MDRYNRTVPDNIGRTNRTYRTRQPRRLLGDLDENDPDGEQVDNDEEEDDELESKLKNLEVNEDD
ncbi:hypothetical protein Bca4012_036347 [Brassica carinata]